MVKALCFVLASRAGWAWAPTGQYEPEDVAVFYGALGTAPDRAVGVTPYAPSDDLETGLAVRRVQIRHRGAPYSPSDADDLADTTFAALQGMARVAGISLVVRVSSVRLGADGNGRQERTDNYQITLDNPEAS